MPQCRQRGANHVSVSIEQWHCGELGDDGGHGTNGGKPPPFVVPPMHNGGKVASCEALCIELLILA